ncbi:probable serine carboxypeptidase CPVL [Galendromus occidentalis]|uniref:Probable serine carboxypeptidase CPVL n=1 Tax=Galendromus occidentalis TaxID=34638 RepID=A0AAJ6W118_9ACAR|nr:probable serine carboxypeptidase CPVL [Galendromus occidentalis]
MSPCRRVAIFTLLPLIWIASSAEQSPLLLTPLISRNELLRARNLSLVGSLDGCDNPETYSGYLTVNETTNANLFFWFIPAMNTSPTAPVVLWLQGSPGSSSLFGLFVEHGPYEVTKNLSLQPRASTWAKSFNMLYIDNPVGAGFSYVSPDGHARNFSDVGRDLFIGLQQFFTLFDEYGENDFYVAGESFAGKFVPALAHEILRNNLTAKMNLQGIIIGSSLCDPPTMMSYADFLLNLGLISEIQAKYFKRQERIVLESLKENDYVKAFEVFSELINGNRVNRTKSYFQRKSGFSLKFNALQAKEPEAYNYFKGFLKLNGTRQALHVGNASFNDGLTVRQSLKGEMMKSVKPWIEEALERRLKVLIYSGQFDIIVPYPLSRSFVNSIGWGGAQAFSEARRLIWRNETTGEPVGYVRQFGVLTEVLVRNAGHFVPFDAPRQAYDMMDRFINNKAFGRSSRMIRTSPTRAKQ